MRNVISVIEPITTNYILSTYQIDIDGEVNAKQNINTLHFNYPYIDFLENVFLSFLENINSEYIYLTRGVNLNENSSYLKFKKTEFIQFVIEKTDYIDTDGYTENIETYYLIGLTIFDETLNWLIHKNVDIGDITFSYKINSFNELKNIEENEWLYK